MGLIDINDRDPFGPGAIGVFETAPYFGLMFPRALLMMR